MKIKYYILVYLKYIKLLNNQVVDIENKRLILYKYNLVRWHPLRNIQMEMNKIQFNKPQLLLLLMNLN